MEDMAHPPPDPRSFRQCWCLNVHLNPDGTVRAEIPCTALVPPDQPFCGSCEDRHWLAERNMHGRLIVTTRPLPV